MIGVKQLFALVSSAVVFFGGVLMQAGDSPGGVALEITPAGATSLVASAPAPFEVQGLRVIEVRAPADLPFPPALVQGAVGELVLVASAGHGTALATLGAETLRIPAGSMVRITDFVGRLDLAKGDLATVLDADGVARTLTVGPPFGSPVSTLLSDERGIPVSSLLLDGVAVHGARREAGTFGSIDARFVAPADGPVPDLGLGGEPFPVDREITVEFEDFVGVIITVVVNGDHLRLGLEGYANVTVAGIPVDPRISEERRIDLPGTQNEAPVAAFTFRPTTPAAHDTIEFIDQSLDDMFVSEWHWDLGDGASSNAPHPSHAYDAAGLYTVTLTVWDAQGEMSSTEQTVRVTPTPPEVELDWVPHLPVELELVQFTATVDDPEGDVESIEWRFSDGLAFEGPAVQRSFARGLYDLSVVATDATGTKGWANGSFSVTNAPPLVSFDAVPAEPIAGAPAVLRSTSRDVGAGSIVSQSWHVEGVPGSLPGDEVSVVFPRDGSFEVTLTVTDDEGARESLTRAITVANPPPVVSIRVLPELPNPGRAVSLIAQIDDDDRPRSIEWTLPGGGTRTGMVLSYTFPSGGLYDVGLTVTDADGASASATRTIRVNHPPVVAIAQATPVVHTGEPADFAAHVTDADGDAITYAWTLNGRVAGTDAAFSKTWNDDANHTVRLTATDAHGAVGRASAAVVVLNRPPTVAPRIDGSVVNLNQAVTLVAGARDVDGSIAAVRWLSGDTVLGAGERLVHTFRAAGPTTLDVVVTDDDGARTRVPFSFSVNSPPQVSASASPLDVDAGAPVTFEASATDVEGHAISYLWELGDGTTSTEPSLGHAYAAEGSYRPKLTVSDSAGGRVVRTWTIDVRVPDLPLEIDVSPNHPRAGEEIEVSVVLPEGREVEAITWDLGDGSEPVETGAGVTTLHVTYAEPRTFPLSVHVEADFGSVGDEAIDLRITGAVAHAVRVEPLLPDGQCVNLDSPDVVARATNLATGTTVALDGDAQRWTREGSCTLLYNFPRGSWSVGDGLDLLVAVGAGTTMRVLDFEVDGDLRLMDLVVDAAGLDLTELVLETASAGSGATFTDPTEAVYARGALAWADGTPSSRYEVGMRVTYRGPLSPDSEGIDYAEWTVATAADGSFRTLVPAPLVGTDLAFENDPAATSFVYAPGQYGVLAQATSGALTSTSSALFAEDPLGILETLRSGGIIG